jgi:hypothetical protein
VDYLKLGAKKPPLPFADVQLLENLTHTFWFLPAVSACDALFFAPSNLQPDYRFRLSNKKTATKPCAMDGARSKFVHYLKFVN